MKLLKLLLVFVFLFITPFANAFELNTTGKNANFIFEKEPKALATNIAVVIPVGSAYDPKGKEGLHYLTFESIIHGTQSKKRVEFANAIESLGATINVDVTSSRTIISLTVINENLAAAIDLLAEALLTPGLRPDEFEQLRAEELAALNAESANNRVLMRRAYRLALYQDSPLAYPANGTMGSLKHISIDDVKKVLSDSICAARMRIAVSSNQSKKKIRSLLEHALQGLPKGTPVTPITVTPVVRTGRDLYIVPRSGATTTEIAIGHPGIKANDPLELTLSVGSFIFGIDFSSRLMRVLRVENGWTYGATAGYHLIDLPRYYGGFFTIYAFPQVQYYDKAVLKALELFEAYVKNGVTKEELEFAQNSMRNSYAFNFASAQARINSKIHKALDGAPNYSINAYRRRVGKMTVKDIASAVKSRLNAENLAIVVVGEEKDMRKLSTLIPKVKRTFLVKDPVHGSLPELGG